MDFVQVSKQEHYIQTVSLVRSINYNNTVAGGTIMSLPKSPTQSSAASVHHGALIAAIEVGPHDDPTMSLGMFEKTKQPKGFYIEFANDAEPAEAVKTSVTAHTLARNVEYTLHVVNKSNRSLYAEVWQL